MMFGCRSAQGLWCKDYSALSLFSVNSLVNRLWWLLFVGAFEHIFYILLLLKSTLSSLCYSKAIKKGQYSRPEQKTRKDFEVMRDEASTYYHNMNKRHIFQYHSLSCASVSWYGGMFLVSKLKQSLFQILIFCVLLSQVQHFLHSICQVRQQDCALCFFPAPKYICLCLLCSVFFFFFF